MNNRIAVFGDLHLGVHQNSDFWLDVAKTWIDWFIADITERKIDTVVFCGDFLHTRDEVSVKTLHFASDVIDKFRDFDLYMITGNHDCYYKETSEVNSIAIFKGRKGVTVIDKPITINIKNAICTFCPWGTDINIIPKSDAIFGHFELKYFRMNAFKMCDSGIEPTGFVDKAPIVFTGHFHTRDEKLFGQTKIIYTGNPFQMDFGDISQNKGYYIYNTDTQSSEFIECEVTPKHFKINLSEIVNWGVLFDKKLKECVPNNIVRLIVDRMINTTHLEKLNSYISSLHPCVYQVDHDIYYNKVRLAEEVSMDLSSVDITKSIQEFVNLLDIQNKTEVTDYTVNLYNRAKIA